MEKGISLKKNFIMNAILTMSSFIFPLITFPYVSRVLLPAGTGKVSFATSLISYFALFSQLGIPTYGVRVCSQVRDNRQKLSKTAFELLYINIFMCFITYIVFLGAILYIPRLKEDRVLYIIVSVTILLNAIGMEWLYRALEKYTYITIRSLIFKAIALLGMFLLVHEEQDYVIYGAISIFASSASNIMNFIHAKKYIDFCRITGLQFKMHLKAIGVFFAMACATTIYTHLDVLMLGFMKSDIEVGYYHAAVRIKQILVSIVTSLGAVLLPRSSYYVKKGEIAEFKRITGKALSFVMLCATPLTVFFILFAAQGILLLSGADYVGSIIPMQIIMPTVLLIGITNVLGIQVLIPLEKETVVLKSEIAGAIVDLGLNLLLIPKMGAAGAAIGTLVAEFVVLVVQYRALRAENINEQFETIHFGSIIMAIIIASGVSFWTKYIHVFNSLTWNSFTVLVIAFFVYWGIYLAFLTVKKEAMVIEIEKMIWRRLRTHNQQL